MCEVLEDSTSHMKTGKIKVKSRTKLDGTEQSGLIVSKPTQSFIVNELTIVIDRNEATLILKGLKADESEILTVKLR